MASFKLPGPIVLSASNTGVIDDGTMCRALSPRPGSAGVMSVKDWPLERRLLEVATLTAPRLPGEMRDQFLAMFSPANIGIMVGFILVVVGAHMSPFAIAALIADGLTFLVGFVMIGMAIMDVARDLATFGEKTKNATSHADLDTAAASLARAVSILGVTVITAFIAKNAGRGMRKLTSSSRAPKTNGTTKLYEMVRVENKADGVMAEAFRKAAVKELAAEKLLEKNPNWEMQSKPGQLKSRAGQNAHGETIRPRKIADSYVEGHKLTAAMGQRNLPKGTEIIQFVRADGKIGVWCSYLGATPQELAIIAKGRIQMRFIVEKPMTVWESTAASFEVGKVPGVGGPGGGRQLWMPEGWQNSVRTIWEAPANTTFGAGFGLDSHRKK